MLQSLTYVVEMLTGSISCFTVHMAGPPDQVSELGAAYLYAWSTATGSFGARNGAKIATGRAGQDDQRDDASLLCLNRRIHQLGLGDLADLAVGETTAAGGPATVPSSNPAPVT